MPPEAYRALSRAARDEGFEHLGDWLAQLPGLLYEESHIPSARRLGHRLVRKRFVAIAAQASELMESLFDLADYDPTLTNDKSVSEAWGKLEHAWLKVKTFVVHEARPPSRP